MWRCDQAKEVRLKVHFANDYDDLCEYNRKKKTDNQMTKTVSINHKHEEFWKLKMHWTEREWMWDRACLVLFHFHLHIQIMMWLNSRTNKSFIKTSK